MDRFTLMQLVYLAAVVLFVFGLKWLSSPRTARAGNLLAALGMLLAVVATLFHHEIISWPFIVLGVAIGNWVYPQGRRNFVMADYGDEGAVRGLRYLGHHSLTIYLLHQPILFGIVYLFSLLRRQIKGDR